MCCQRSKCVYIYIHISWFSSNTVLLFISLLPLLKCYKLNIADHSQSMHLSLECLQLHAYFLSGHAERISSYISNPPGRNTRDQLPACHSCLGAYSWAKVRCFSTDCCHHKTFLKKLFVHPDGSPNKSEKIRMEGGKTNAKKHKRKSSQFVVFIYQKKQWTQIGDQSFLHSHRLP